MEGFVEWFKNNPDVLGFTVATVIFLFTVLLLSRRAIGFFVTLLLLMFALVAGFGIANYGSVSNYIKKDGIKEQVSNMEESLWDQDQNSDQ